MPLMNLSVSSFPFSINGVAGINLMVLVTDETGTPYTGLQEQNFTVRWIDNVSIDEKFKLLTFAEYNSANQLPDIPGVYQIELMSESASWTQLTTFHIAVHEDQKHDHGQTLYRIDDSAFSQMT
jgi:hypothetical protein